MRTDTLLKFALPLLICWLLAAACAWIFGSAMQTTYPEGILVFAPEPGRPPIPSDAFYIGMALGAFFCSLIFAAMTASAFLLNRLKSSPLQHLCTPLLLACLSTFGFCLVCVLLAD